MVQQRLRDSRYSISVHNQNKHNYKTKVRRVECKQTKNQIKKDITKTGKELDFCSTYDIDEYSKIKIASPRTRVHAAPAGCWLEIPT